ncbi:MAG TPA: addiction module protein [Pyrinomonadaceae bacterium]|nr:addiction module protein [Pyrinomonadaceae bacterium]
MSPNKNLAATNADLRFPRSSAAKLKSYHLDKSKTQRDLLNEPLAIVSNHSIPCLRSRVILNFGHEHERPTSCKNLPLPERLELLDALWESIVEEGYEPPLTTAQADELDRRLKAHQRNPDDVVDWKAIKTELDSKFGRD